MRCIKASVTMCVLLLGLGFVGTARSETPAGESKKDGPVEIHHIIFLIHPCVYESVDPKLVLDKNYTQFVEREKEVKQKWLKAAETADAGTLLLQLYGAKSLYEALKEKMGEARACFVHAELPPAGDGQQAEYHRRLVETIRAHMKKHGLAFDPAKTTSEIWGESFEGCAPGYASAFAEGLGLKILPKMRFEMTVFDSRFLYGAKRLEVIPIPNTDVEAMLFELYDGTLAAIYQARLTAQWLDARPITVQLDPTRTQVCTKPGHTVWPAKPWQKGDPAGAVSFTLTPQNSYWVRGITMSYDDFRKIIAEATVGSAPK